MPAYLLSICHLDYLESFQVDFLTFFLNLYYDASLQILQGFFPI